ncbi:hypothetical protein SNE40_016369 [Patella caerulea]|uniref:Sushi domain-containing protein n=1 Tax=Patella caerulea TaxID=87958 RepID=A0AAN8JBA2_PATCE
MLFISAVIIVVTATEKSGSAIACGKYQYVSNTGTCLPCRICPRNIHSALGRIESNCPVSSPSWLPGKFISCSGRQDPVPWCEQWSDEHGNVTCLYGNMTIGSNCTLQCANGYVVDVDYASLQCTGNLSWLPAIKPVCRPITISDNITEIGTAKAVLKSEPRDDNWYVIGGSVGSVLILIIVIVVILCKKFKVSPSKIKKKLCGSPPDPTQTLVESKSPKSENVSQSLMENDGTTQPLTVELPPDQHYDDEKMVINIQPNGVVNDADVVDELVVPEITEENAGTRQLINVYKNTRAMEILRVHFECIEKQYRVTWHVMAKEILHMESPAINNLEYHRKGDYSNGPFIAIMEKMTGNGVTLKQILDFLFKFRSDVPPSQEVENKDINIIIKLLLQFVKS